MANIEHAVAGLETILVQDLPAQLSVQELLWKDGIKLEPLRQIEWEEIRGAINTTPAALIIGSDDNDVVGRDMLFDATIYLYVILTDRSKKSLTKKLYRYAQAVRDVLKTPRNHTLRGVIVSAKVVRVKYSPTFVDRTNLFMRDFEATVMLRLPRGD